MRKPGHDHPEPQSVDMLRKLGYESSDVSVGVLLKWIGFLFIFIGGSAVVTFLIYVIFLGAPTAPASGVTVGKLPEGTPAVQASPKVDMRVFRQQEDAKADGYGWVDKANGIAHIPVGEAMDKVIAAGALPKAEPGAGKIAPARGEDLTHPGMVPSTATPGGGASRGPAAEAEIPGMPGGTAPRPSQPQPESTPAGGGRVAP